MRDDEVNAALHPPTDLFCSSQIPRSHFARKGCQRSEASLFLPFPPLCLLAVVVRTLTDPTLEFLFCLTLQQYPTTTTTLLDTNHGRFQPQDRTLHRRGFARCAVLRRTDFGLALLPSGVLLLR